MRREHHDNDFDAPGNVARLPAARRDGAALEALMSELHARGWRVAEAPNRRDAESISKETVQRALSRISDEGGATAAEVGREVLGEEARLVQHLPPRVGADLRRLQLEGKVERRENGGSPRGFLTASS
jgi:hypothetical protein